MKLYKITYTTVYRTKKTILLEAENSWDAEKRFHNQVSDIFETDSILYIKDMCNYIDKKENK